MTTPGPTDKRDNRPMSSEPRVAAIIPYFMGRQYLTDAVASALAQTYEQLEVIVINDGSPDDFQTVIAPLRSRVRVVEQENLGVAAARNRGLRETQAEYVAFLDQDDVWRKDKIERQVKLLESFPEVGLAHTEACYIDQHGLPTAPPRLPFVIPKAHGRCTLELLAHNSITTSSVLLRRAALGLDRFPNGMDGCDDWDVWLRVSRTWAFAYIDEPLTYYRVHDANVSRDKAVMIPGRVKVLERARHWNGSAEVRNTVDRHFQAALTDLAHLEYEKGNLERARELLAAGGGRFRQRSAMMRYVATFLPEPVYPRARAFWRAARRLIAGSSE
jgi:glycosyltransferase involved in cell wall biosynthesis